MGHCVDLVGHCNTSARQLRRGEWHITSKFIIIVLYKNNYLALITSTNAASKTAVIFTGDLRLACRVGSSSMYGMSRPYLW